MNVRLKKACIWLQEMNPRKTKETTDSHTVGLGVQADLYGRKDGEKVDQHKIGLSIRKFCYIPVSHITIRKSRFRF